MRIFLCSIHLAFWLNTCLDVCWILRVIALLCSKIRWDGNYEGCIEDPLELNPDSSKNEKWTYQLLAECKPLVEFCRMVLNDFRRSEEQFYSKTHRRHIFEWCLLIDNSGTMMSKVSIETVHLPNLYSSSWSPTKLCVCAPAVKADARDNCPHH